MLIANIESDNWTTLCLASKQLSLELLLEETHKAATWGPIPQVDNNTYFVEKRRCTENLWCCFTELIGWGAAMLCRNGEAIILDKPIVELFIDALRLVLAALAGAAELALEKREAGVRFSNKLSRSDDDYSFG